MLLLLVLSSFLYLSNGKYTVLTTPNPPLVTCVVGSNDRNQMEGFSIELITEIANNLNWKDDEWEINCTGNADMLRKVKLGEATMAEAGIAITSEYLDEYKFSTPTFDSGLVIIVKNINQEFFWLLLEPFNWDLWIIILTSGIFMGHILWILERNKEGDIPYSYIKGITEAVYYSYLSLVFLGNVKLRTIPARILQVAYWTVAFVLFGAYVGDLASRLSVPMNTNTIRSFRDLDGKKVGTYEQYSSVVEEYGATVKLYEKSEEGNDQLFSDLKSEKIDAAITEVPIANMYNSNDCVFKIVDDIFVPIYYGIIFPYNADDVLIQDISTMNSLMFEANIHRSLKNKYMLVTTEESCSYEIKTPVMLDQTKGMWVLLAIGAGIGVPLYFLYRRYLLKFESDQAAIRAMKKKLETTLSRETDLLDKFESILMVSQDNLSDKIKDLENILIQHSNSSNSYEDAIRLLSQKIDLLHGF